MNQAELCEQCLGYNYITFIGIHRNMQVCISSYCMSECGNISVGTAYVNLHPQHEHNLTYASVLFKIHFGLESGTGKILYKSYFCIFSRNENMNVSDHLWLELGFDLLLIWSRHL